MTVTHLPTHTDRVILAGLARGRTSSQIAADIRTRPSTVRTRCDRLRRRIGARNGAHAVAIAYDRGWLKGLRPEARPEARLPHRQLQIMGYVAEGLTNHEIAEQLGISLNTVGAHLRRAYRRLGATSRPQAVAVARQHGHLTAAVAAPAA